MAYLVIEINASGQSIADFNSAIQKPGKPHDAVNALLNLLNGVNGGNYPATVQVTSRSTTAGVSTGGSGSQQELYTLK